VSVCVCVCECECECVRVSPELKPLQRVCSESVALCKSPLANEEEGCAGHAHEGRGIWGVVRGGGVCLCVSEPKAPNTELS